MDGKRVQTLEYLIADWLNGEIAEDHLHDFAMAIRVWFAALSLSDRERALGEEVTRLKARVFELERQIIENEGIPY